MLSSYNVYPEGLMMMYALMDDKGFPMGVADKLLFRAVADSYARSNLEHTCLPVKDAVLSGMLSAVDSYISLYYLRPRA